MKHALYTLDQRLGGYNRAVILTLAACGVVVVGGVDYLTGYEISLSLLYLGPVALATWYGGRAGIGIAIFACLIWYAAEMGTGRQYSHPTIPVWNAFVRFGFFLVTSVLLAALRDILLDHRHQARTDSLTGLYGRREFESRLEHDLALAHRHKSALTLVYMDLDNFKTVNDLQGHSEGDRVLRAVGQVLNDTARKTDTAARLGGDEFALVLPDTDYPGAQQFIAKLTSGLEAAFEGNQWPVTSSIGVVTFLDSATPVQKAVETVDELMYEVKRAGKGAVAFSVLGTPVQT